MFKAILVVLVLLLAVAGGGLVFLAGWDIPAPTKHVDRVLPDDQFPR